MLYLVYYTTKDGREGLRVFTTHGKAAKWVNVYENCLEKWNLLPTLTDVDKQP